MLYLELAIVAVLIVVNGLLSMSELAIVSSRPARLAAMVEKGVTGSRRALVLASNPGKFLSTVQIGITLIGVLSGAAPAFAEPGPSALAYPPPFIDHAEWTQWNQLPSLRVYPTRSGRDAARQLGSSTPAADEA